MAKKIEVIKNSEAIPLVDRAIELETNKREIETELEKLEIVLKETGHLEIFERRKTDNEIKSVKLSGTSDSVTITDSFKVKPNPGVIAAIEDKLSKKDVEKVFDRVVTFQITDMKKMKDILKLCKAAGISFDDAVESKETLELNMTKANEFAKDKPEIAALLLSVNETAHLSTKIGYNIGK